VQEPSLFYFFVYQLRAEIVLNKKSALGQILSNHLFPQNLLQSFSNASKGLHTSYMQYESVGKYQSNCFPPYKYITFNIPL